MPIWVRRVIITVATVLMACATVMLLWGVGGQWPVGVAAVALVLLTLWIALDIEARQRDAR